MTDRDQLSGRVDGQDALVDGQEPETDTTDLTGPLRQPAGVASLPSRLRTVYRTRTGTSERALLHSWMAFSATFATARVVTHTLRRRDKGSGGSGGIVIAGRHLHHYNLGILLLAAVGGVGVHGQADQRQHPVTAAAFGSGVALIVDELALLIDLSDVYWANDGRTSVDAAVGVIGVGGALLAAVPFWKGAAQEVLRTRPKGA